MSAILLKNVFNEGAPNKTSNFNRTFIIDNNMGKLSSFTSVVQVSFFDLYDDVRFDK